jgi:hypothetical protein
MTDVATIRLIFPSRKSLMHLAASPGLTLTLGVILELRAATLKIEKVYYMTEKNGKIMIK